MASQTSDRLRTRSDLRELAKLAKPVAGGPDHGFDSADSSGYVDLSAFSARDEGWVERELARAKNGAPPPPSSAAVRAIDALKPESMVPVALESFTSADTTAGIRVSRARKALYVMSGLAGVIVVAFLTVAMAKHAPPAPAAPAVAAAAPAAPPVAPDPAAQLPAAAAVTPPAATAPLAVAVTAPAATPASGPGAAAASRPTHKSWGAPRAHAAAPPAVAANTHVAASKPVVIPASKPSGGSNDLMDLIKKSVATGK